MTHVVITRIHSTTLDSRYCKSSLLGRQAINRWIMMAIKCSRHLNKAAGMQAFVSYELCCSLPLHPDISVCYSSCADHCTICTMYTNMHNSGWRPVKCCKQTWAWTAGDKKLSSHVPIHAVCSTARMTHDDSMTHLRSTVVQYVLRCTAIVSVTCNT